MKKRTKGIFLVSVAAVAVVGIVAAMKLKNNFTSSEGEGVLVQTVSSVNCADNGMGNRYSGVVETQKTEKVEFDGTRDLVALLVEEGQSVDKGTPLFTYDTTSISLDIQQAQLSVEQLNMNLKNQQDQLAQLQKDMGAASSQDKLEYTAQIQQMQADIAQSQYDIKTKEAEVVKLQKTLENATVTSPMAGSVKEIKDLEAIKKGTSYGDDGSPDNTYIVIVAEGDFRIKGTVTEQNVMALSEGMSVIIRSRVDENQTWQGTITTIDTQNQVKDNNNMYGNSGAESSSKYSFYVDPSSTDGLILGQHVTLEQDNGGLIKKGIWLDSGWIVDADSSPYVWAAKEGGRLEKLSVTLGERDDNLDQYEIKDGLTKDMYLAWPDEACTSGAAVIFDNPEEMEEEPLVADGEEVEGVQEMMPSDGTVQEAEPSDGAVQEAEPSDGADQTTTVIGGADQATTVINGADQGVMPSDGAR